MFCKFWVKLCLEPNTGIAFYLSSLEFTRVSFYEYVRVGIWELPCPLRPALTPTQAVAGRRWTTERWTTAAAKATSRPPIAARPDVQNMMASTNPWSCTNIETRQWEISKHFRATSVLSCIWKYNWNKSYDI